jgi:maleate isomerase
MYGWRAKIGRISPSPETVGCEEWRRALPEGVCLVETRTLLHDVTVKGLAETVKQVERAALELASAEVDVIVQAGTAIAFFRGFGHDQELSRRITAATGIQATTSLTAVVEALRVMGISSAGDSDLSCRHRHAVGAVLQQSGFEVARFAAWDSNAASTWAKSCRMKPIDWLARSHAAQPTPTVSLSPAAICAAQAIEPLKPTPFLPVVTSNQAGLWQALRMVGIGDRLPSLGRLLSEY